MGCEKVLLQARRIRTLQNVYRQEKTNLRANRIVLNLKRLSRKSLIRVRDRRV